MTVVDRSDEELVKMRKKLEKRIKKLKKS